MNFVMLERIKTIYCSREIQINCRCKNKKQNLRYDLELFVAFEYQMKDKVFNSELSGKRHWK